VISQAEHLYTTQQRRLKGGGSQDWLPHNQQATKGDGLSHEAHEIVAADSAALR
jgi:hypothetical protein